MGDGPQSNRLFAVNAGMHRLGIAEPQLSLMALARRWNYSIARTMTSPFELALPRRDHWRSTTSTDNSEVLNLFSTDHQY